MKRGVVYGFGCLIFSSPKLVRELPYNHTADLDHHKGKHSCCHGFIQGSKTSPEDCGRLHTKYTASHISYQGKMLSKRKLKLRRRNHIHPSLLNSLARNTRGIGAGRKLKTHKKWADKS